MGYNKQQGVTSHELRIDHPTLTARTATDYV